MKKIKDLFYSDLKKIPRLSQDEFSELLAQGTQEAKYKIWQASVRLVYMAARKYQKKLGTKCSLTPDDLISAGTIGILRAIETYRPEKGSFTQWVWLNVTSHLQTEIWRYQKIVKYPFSKSRQDPPYQRCNIAGWDAPIKEKNKIDPEEILCMFGRTLSEKQRHAVREYYINGLYDSQIAGELGCTKQNISELRRQGVDKLRRLKNRIAEEIKD